MLDSIDELKGIGYEGYQLTVHRRKQSLETAIKKTTITRPRNGESTAPYFLTNTPKNFEGAV